MSASSTEQVSIGKWEIDRLAVSPAEAARLMGVGRTITYELIASGALRSSKIGNRRVITLKAIHDCLAAHEVKP